MEADRKQRLSSHDEGALLFFVSLPQRVLRPDGRGALRARGPVGAMCGKCKSPQRGVAASCGGVSKQDSPSSVKSTY